MPFRAHFAHFAKVVSLIIDNRKFAFQNCEPCEDFVWTLFYPCDSTVQRRETQFNDVLRDDMHLKYDNFEVFEI